MWVLLAAIVAISLALAAVTAARREQPASSPCCGCAPCLHTCQQNHAA